MLGCTDHCRWYGKYTHVCQIMVVSLQVPQSVRIVNSTLDVLLKRIDDKEYSRGAEQPVQSIAYMYHDMGNSIKFHHLCNNIHNFSPHESAIPRRCFPSMYSYFPKIKQDVVSEMTLDTLSHRLQQRKPNSTLTSRLTAAKIKLFASVQISFHLQLCPRSEKDRLR